MVAAYARAYSKDDMSFGREERLGISCRCFKQNWTPEGSVWDLTVPCEPAKLVAEEAAANSLLLGFGGLGIYSAERSALELRIQQPG